ncbi:MAG: Protein-L-isoaspartate(D-aspartate) O-methyltransferase [Clostridiales bacterium]|jgi:protein-L-isoaspartate(D-aspartate) O-methyltransferase|nr:Protein-L-isoaspartate(D-aspartate) O-methyltransferase [Clostridiales bacterium]
MEGNKIIQKELYEFFINLDRSFFIDNENKEFAHYDEALPIGFEQTISKPSLVYEMTARLDLDKKHKVLEIGTGSGYQTVFLAEFAGQVYTVERIKELSWKALGRLMQLGYQNINFKIGNGSEGWLEFAPYDRIIVTAGAGQLPEALLEQLKPGGKMIIPLGRKNLQELMMIDKDAKGNFIKKPLGPVTFVEFKGEYGWNN